MISRFWQSLLAPVSESTHTHSRLQESVINWGSLLIATGGALKPGKCSYYLISFRWKADGTWVYENNAIRPDLAIGVPLVDGRLAEIEHLPVESAIKTLGSMTCPTGSSASALGRMQQQGQEWADRVKSGKLSRRNMWFMMDRQFWPRVGYGISNTSASWEQLDQCLRRVYWQLVPRGGEQGTAAVPLRQLDRGFYGIGSCTREWNASLLKWQSYSYTMNVNQASESRCKSPWNSSSRS